MTPVVLVEVTRRDVGSGRHVVESRHHGHLVLVDGDGVEHALGDPGHLTFVRSAAKPFQASACLEILADATDARTLTQEEIAVAWASHRAEPHHLDAVRLLLGRSGRAPEGLTCPPATIPDDPASGERRIHHNCSGKHAMFALAGAALGLERDDLLDPAGPLQRRVLAHLDEAVGPSLAVGVDGCGAPAVATRLRRLAVGFRSLVADDRYRAVRMAGSRCPSHVGGRGRLESALLSTGVVAKPGAEGVFAASWLDRDGAPWAAALKIEDGASRASAAAMHGLLRSAEVIPPDLWAPDPVLGGGQPEGAVRPGTEVTTLGREVARV